jgi:hypothetical protein
LFSSGRITFEEFEDFMHTYDIDEALGPFFNRNGIEVKTQVQFVDVSTLQKTEAAELKPKYREYPDD